MGNTLRRSPHPQRRSSQDLRAIVAFAIPAGTTFQPKTESLLQDQIITGERTWVSDSGVVLSERVTAVGDFFDPVGPNGRTYDWELSFGAWVFGEVMDDQVTFSGTAEETLGNTFNLLVFNQVNFDLWELDQPSSAFYSQSNVVDHTFSFNLNKDQATGLMYFVMEKTSEAQPLLSIRILANADWVEENRFPVLSYESVFTPLILAAAENFVLSGTASESSDINFNFYILDSNNRDRWAQGQDFSSFFESIGESSASFSVPLTETQADFEILYFVVENPGLIDQDVVATVSAKLDWIEKNEFPSPPYDSAVTPLLLQPTENFVLSGTAVESSGTNFNLYILDADNFMRWSEGQPFTSIYESTGTSSASFSVPLTETQADFEILYFVVENPGLLDQDVTVTISANLDYSERALVSGAIAGVLLGGTIAVLGVILLVVGVVLAFVLKPRP